ncbi:MAG: DUF1830 domain-containing protein [Cyanobacteriota bacterium]
MKRYAFINASGQVQVIRTIPGHWERTLFPGQHVIFEAEPDDYLEIYSCSYSTALLEERRPCRCLSDSAGLEVEASHYQCQPPELGILVDAVNG